MKKWTKHGAKAQIVAADGEVRRSKAVRTHGAGSLLDLVERSALVGGLDFWRGAEQGVPIVEPRLQRQIAAMVKNLDESFALSAERPFLPPPVRLDGDPHPGCGIEVFEFPRWFVCQNPECRVLVRAPEGLELKGGRWEHLCDSRKRSPAVPVRFVMACKNGHLDEVPWLYFTHEARGKDRCASPQLKLVDGKTGDFSEVEARCVCGSRAPLANLLLTESNPKCHGYRPWLGPEGGEVCEERPRLLTTGASNTYFSQVVSGLSIPDGTKRLETIVSGLLGVLGNADATSLPVLRQASPALSQLGDVSDQEVLQALENVKNPTQAKLRPLRTAEFIELTGQPDYKKGILPADDDQFFARRYRPEKGLPTGIEAVVLALRLREVSVQVGFTRLEAPTPNLQGEYDLGVSTCRLGLNTDWLPASENWGEGVLLQLDEAAVQHWEKRPAVQQREALLREGHQKWLGDRDHPDFPGIRFYLLHSLSHLLLNAIAVECGYSAAALSERIYCAPAIDEVPMAAVLISTGTPGTEGTLGGLVEQGKEMVAHLQRAYDMGRLCSNDPVCANHNPVNNPTRRYREGAACHGCLYVAEPTCERFNAYLDRALVVPTLGLPEELAFFRGRPEV